MRRPAKSIRSTRIVAFGIVAFGIATLVLALPATSRAEDSALRLPDEPADINPTCILAEPDFDRDAYRTLVSRVNDALERGEFGDAANGLYEMAERFSGHLLPDASHNRAPNIYARYIKQRTVIADVFGKFPLEVKRAALERFEMTARMRLRAQMTTLQTESDRESVIRSLAQIRKEFAPSPSAIDAAVLEARLCFEENEPFAALMAILTIERYVPDWKTKYPDVFVAKIMSLKSIGRAHEANALVNENVGMRIEFDGIPTSLADVIGALQIAPFDSGTSRIESISKPGIPVSAIASIDNTALFAYGGNLGNILDPLRRLFGSEPSPDVLNSRVTPVFGDGWIYQAGARDFRRVNLMTGAIEASQQISERIEEVQGGQFGEMQGNAFSFRFSSDEFLAPTPVRNLRETMEGESVYTVAYPRGRMSNQFRGTDLVKWNRQTGEVVWRVPADKPEPGAVDAFGETERAFYHQVQFASQPAIVGDQIITGVTIPLAKDLEFWMVSFDKNTGLPRWRTRVGTTFQLSSDNPMNLVSAGDTITEASPILILDNLAVLCTNRGIVASIDIRDGSLVWSIKYGSIGRGRGERYSFLESLARRRLETSRGLGWFDGTVNFAGGALIVTPMDSDRCWCIEPESGALRWQSHDASRGRFVLGFSDTEVFYQRGDARVAAVSLANGQITRVSEPLSQHPTYRGCYKDGLISMCSDERLYLIEASSFEVIYTWEIEPRRNFLNRNVYGGDVSWFTQDGNLRLVLTNDKRTTIYSAESAE
ncbi:MAG: PQQ-like beta-propeller repeat protein [Planctomycetes bacterium]|nr:PQQ-like beta-propeller repeat protein [Planctomycetota bacterium]